MHVLSWHQVDFAGVLLSGLDGAWSAKGALSALVALQARERDDWRDAEPGKLLHECRRGELASRNCIPFAPAYYGTHDTPALYCLTLWHAWCWTGDDELLKAHLETAKAAMRWCDELGDRDGDGLLEYATRSPKGYYNQSWKDAGDVVVHTDGSRSHLPLANVELQGYLFAARLAMAELLAVQGNRPRLSDCGRRHTLRDIVEERYRMEEEGFYAFALDGEKQQVARTVCRHRLCQQLPHPGRKPRHDADPARPRSRLLVLLLLPDRARPSRSHREQA